MTKIRINVAKYGEDAATGKPMVVSLEDPTLTFHGFVEQATKKVGLEYTPSHFALTVDDAGTPTYLTSLQELQHGLAVYIYEYKEEGGEQQQAPEATAEPSIESVADATPSLEVSPTVDEEVPPPPPPSLPPPEEDEEVPPPPPSSANVEALLTDVVVPHTSPNPTRWKSFQPRSREQLDKEYEQQSKSDRSSTQRTGGWAGAQPTRRGSNIVLRAQAEVAAEEPKDAPQVPRIGLLARKPVFSSAPSLQGLSSTPSSPATAKARPISVKILTFEVFYFSLYQKPDNSHVLIEFDFAVQQIKRYKKDKPLPILAFGDIAQHSISQEGTTHTLNLHLKTQPPSNTLYSIATSKEAEEIGYLLNCIVTKSFQDLARLKPRLCIKRGVVETGKKSLLKGATMMYVVITDRKLFGFTSEEMNQPLVALELSSLTITKKKESEIVLDCKHFKQVVFSFTLETVRNYWYDSLMKAVEITDASVHSLIALIDNIRLYYGLPYENDDPAHVALLKELWDLTVPLSPTPPETQFARNSNHWKTIGFQRDDPISDLRAVGLLGLKHLIYLARHYPDLFKEQGIYEPLLSNYGESLTV
eukprot:TRINITY_DN11793_c0_g1_i2.p1 TRINITY_DN11793_c0_g1~~TRINITY_DN11793_c0_g1_i2.p1  ORF type:complete len:587 (+),score=122.33 TRINITY_DN11793_c0_g1_i2:219-1979(+)